MDTFDIKSDSDLDLEQAISLAYAGDIPIMLKIANYYKNCDEANDGIFEERKKYLLMAANVGSVEAMYALGKIYENIDDVQSIEYYQGSF